jgi:hypothetical protein
MIKFFNRYRKRFESNDNFVAALRTLWIGSRIPKTHRGYRYRDKKAPDPGSVTLDMSRGIAMKAQYPESVC